MMKKYVTLLALLVLVLTLCCSLASASSLPTAEKERQYNNAIAQLENWLEGGHDASELWGVYSVFEELGGYNNSRFMAYYVDVLTRVEDNRFDYDTDFDLKIMEKDESFCEYLTDTLEGSLGSVQLLRVYTTARQLEYEGKTKEAIVQYEDCLSFYDSALRYEQLTKAEHGSHYETGEELMEAGDLVGAYREFSLSDGWSDSSVRMAYIVETLGYDPLEHVHDWRTATCDAPKTCSVCGITEGEALGHQWNNGTVTTLTTCVDEGVMTYTCEVCGENCTESILVNAANHVNTHVESKTDATCGAEGYSGDTYCNDCGALINSGSTIPATGNHNWQDATYDAPKTCRVCGKTEGSLLPRVKAGDYITFGHYPQTASGNDNTPIEWMVLKVNEQYNLAFLISKYALDYYPYNNTYSPVTWENSGIRLWLNDFFFNEAFTEKEQGAVLTCSVNNNQCDNTIDRVYLLSDNEAFTYFADDNARLCIATNYAKGRFPGLTQRLENEGKDTCFWWLRSSRESRTEAYFVWTTGSLGYTQVDNIDDAVRPVIWVDINQINSMNSGL